MADDRDNCQAGNNNWGNHDLYTYGMNAGSLSRAVEIETCKMLVAYRLSRSQASSNDQ